jgi:hypothetical protein
VNTFVLNIHSPSEDKIDGVKNSFYEKLEHVFDKFPKYHMKNFLGRFSTKVGKEDKEDTFKLTIWNESVHEISKNDGVRVVNFATSKNLTVKVQCSHNQIDHNLIDKCKCTLMSDYLWK